MHVCKRINTALKKASSMDITLFKGELIMDAELGKCWRNIPVIYEGWMEARTEGGDVCMRAPTRTTAHVHAPPYARALMHARTNAEAAERAALSPKCRQETALPRHHQPNGGVPFTCPHTRPHARMRARMCRWSGA